MRATNYLALAAFLMLAFLCLTVQGQGGGMEDTGGSEDTGQDDMASQDPSILGPTNRHGYGRDVPTQLVDIKKDGSRKDGGGGKTKKGDKIDHGTMAEQTIQAALQFGVLVAVALMVGILFMLNVGVELFVDAVKEKLSDIFGAKKTLDIEDQDPAALVGTFKRYK